MKKRKVFAAAAFAFTLTMGLLAGCGGKTNNELNKIDKNTIYREEKLDISLPANFNMYNTVISGKKIYITGYSYNEQTYEQKILLEIVDLENSNTKTVDMKLENGWINSFVALPAGGFVVSCQSSNYDDSDPDNIVYNEQIELRAYDDDGNLKNTLDISKDYPDSWVNNIIPLDDGLLVDMYDVRLFTDNQLNVTKKQKSEGETDIGTLYRLKDGSVITSKWEDGKGLGYYRLDLNTFETGEAVQMVDTSNYSIMEGKGCDFFFRDNTQIYSYNIGDEKPTPIFNFVNSDLYTSYFNAFEPYDENSFIGTYNDWSSDTVVYNICKYTKVDPAEVKDKEILSLGCVYIDSDIRKFVVDFNRRSEDYRINLVDYSSFNTYDDYTAGMNKFDSDIASGKGPDIIVSNNTDKIANYISKGLYADLSKYIENDPELSIDDILPNVVAATSKNGKIYQIMPSFMIESAAGKKSVLGDREGWTIQEMLEFANGLKSDQILFHEMPRESFLTSALAVSATDYVDPVSAKCNLDSDSFKGILEYMKTLKTSEDYYNELYGDDGEVDLESYEAEVLSGKAICMPVTIYNTNYYKNLLRAEICEPVSFIGYPSEERKGSCLRTNMTIGISSKCKKQQSAWELVREFLLPDYQTNSVYGLPSTKAAFDAACEALKERDYWINENNEKEYYDDTRMIQGKEVVITPLNDDEVQTFKDFVYSVDKLAASYSDIETIIYEEAAAFFEGQKSVDDVVSIIQSRASIFVSEKQ
ncbi:MAG: extracellular solute-binding protein [Lachnospiraceae bacterium]|nr:extracellular solute-binding protein [Lachnospiraceae bacterium]